MRTPYTNNGRYLVSKISSSDDLQNDIERAVGLMGGFDRVISSGDTVTIKPNLASSNPFPASSDPEFIRALVQSLLKAGAKRVQIIESSPLSVSTRKLANRNGLASVAQELGVDTIYLDEHRWMKMEFAEGKYLKSGHIGEPLENLGKLVLAPCLKTHRFARFTGAMKLFVGWLKPRDRLKMHIWGLERKIADLASFFEPSLVVMDARKCFVTGGPGSGQVESSGIILASGDMVSADVEGVRVLQSYTAKNRLNRNIWELPQIAHASDLGIGATCDDEIEVLG